MPDPRHDIPTPAVRRLSLYLRQLEALQTQNVLTVSSLTLGQSLGLTDAQVRKDLAYFGQFGRPGVGYQVEPLIRQLREILGTDRISPTLLVGAGNIGLALARFQGFEPKGFRLVAVFDVDPKKIGRRIGELTVQSMEEMPRVVREMNIKLGIMSVPAEASQQVAEQLVAAGVRGILNFAPASLDVPPGVSVRSVDVAAEMEQLSFQANLFER